jgi:nucleotide-binding universal stress UspA family protein
MEALPREARYHDLVITSHSAPGQVEPGELSPREIIELLLRCVQPMLVTRGTRDRLDRVLLVYDGSDSSGRAIRSFLAHEILPEADVRLLCVGPAADPEGRTLQAMAEYCRTRRPDLETGNLCGSVRRVLLPYAEKWQADLIVMGVTRTSGLLGRLIGQSTLDVLRQSDLALYTTT